MECTRFEIIKQALYISFICQIYFINGRAIGLFVRGGVGIYKNPIAVFSHAMGYDFYNKLDCYFFRKSIAQIAIFSESPMLCSAICCLLSCCPTPLLARHCLCFLFYRPTLCRAGIRLHRQPLSLPKTPCRYLLLEN